MASHFIAGYQGDESETAGCPVVRIGHDSNIDAYRRVCPLTGTFRELPRRAFFGVLSEQLTPPRRM